MKPSSDPVTFARNYLDQFDDENWDGQGIKAATVLSAEWGRRCISGQMVAVSCAKLRLASGEIEDFECWDDNAPHAGSGHIFTAYLKPPTT